MSNFEDFRDDLIALCDKALQGDLSIENFMAIWPKNLSQTEFVLDLLNDLEEGVEHFPAHLFSGKKDFKLWSRSHMAYKLSVDAQLLASGLHEERMLCLRKLILEKAINDKKEIGKLIDEQKFIPGHK